MPARVPMPCIRCGEVVEINESGLALSMFCRTFGIREKLRSNNDQCAICSECAIVVAFGEQPPKSQPLNVMAFHLIRNLVASDPAVAGKAWEELRQRLAMPQLATGEILPPERSLKAAG